MSRRGLAAGIALACGLLCGGAAAETPKTSKTPKTDDAAKPAKTAKTPDAPVGAVAAIDRPAALVGDQVIWKSQLDERLAQAQLQQQAERAAKLLEEMIEIELLVQHARSVRIEVEPSEVDLALNEIKQQNNLDDASLDAALKQQGWTRAAYRDELVRQLLVLRHANQVFRPRVNVTEEDLTKAFAARGAGADRDRLRQELTRERMDQTRIEWLAQQKRRVRIVRRP